MTEQELREIEERNADKIESGRLSTASVFDVRDLLAEARRLQGELEERNAFLEKIAITLTGSGTNEEVLLRIDALFNKRGKQDAT